MADAGPDIFSTTTVVSLSALALISAAAILLPSYLLPAHASRRVHIAFSWHLFDVLVHFTIEAPFLYNCFFESLPVQQLASFANAAARVPVTAPNVYFLGDPARVYGAFYGTGPLSLLWQEYAKADRRWGGTDLGIVSLELMTVGVMAPLALYSLILLTQGKERQAWFWMSVIAVGELYGGWMTFAPDWLAGSPNLNTSHWMYTWLYLTFFNGLWVAAPIYVLYQSYFIFTVESAADIGKKRK